MTEKSRVDEWNAHQFLQTWERWGPFVAERAWGTVREDYSADGDAWNYFPHDHAHLRAYRWGEDGIAALCDRFQVLVFAPVFWNGKDPILKERLFGLNGEEGNHGEDVKECYYYLDGTPTSSYMKYLYKYPQGEFPYAKLVQENRSRGQNQREFELIDTGIFNENRYFDIFIEYAKADPEDICVRIEVINRGPEAAPFHLLGQLWFRNQWGWKETRLKEPYIGSKNGALVADDSCMPTPYLLLDPYHLGKRYLYASEGGEHLFTNNESNAEVLWNQPNHTPYVKDAFHRYLVKGEKTAVNPAGSGTKAAVHYAVPSIAPGKSAVFYFRLTPKEMSDPLQDVESIIALRKKEADQFYEEIHPKEATDEEKMIQRQALAGMTWNKQSYHFAVSTWMQGDFPPPPPSHKEIRNQTWYHLFSMRILAMPDKWEYPWFAAWDLAFHALIHGTFDLGFAKNQLNDLLTDRFQHPNGQIPAYEWEFSDVNPPVQGWVALKLFEMEEEQKGEGDYEFLEKCFHRLLLNFSWWINRIDPNGNNVFEGGFLGMDNIGYCDRSEELKEGLTIDEADGAGWMAFLCLNLMRIALKLATKNRSYAGMATKFFFHFLYIGAAVRIGCKGKGRTYDLWSAEDGFFHSYVRLPDGSAEELPVRSLVGVVPFFACITLEVEEMKKLPEFYLAFQWLLAKRADLTEKMVHKIPGEEKYCLSLLNQEETTQFLSVLWDPNEFRSEFGLRSLSKAYEKVSSTFHGLSLNYEPGESTSKMKGGNSNWRGPIWFCMNYLVIDTLIRLDKAYGSSIKVDGSTPIEMAAYFAESLLKLFKQDKNGRRPIFGDYEKFQSDPHFKDYILFYEHFHGDTGRGLGAAHLTGWTGLIANLVNHIRNRP